MFPDFNHSGVIPPYIFSPTTRDGSPYLTNLVTLIDKLGTTPARLTLIDGLLQYRSALRQIGITSGFQILDGSFTENCEAARGTPPNDIDLVTYAHVPVSPADIPAFLNAHPTLFLPRLTKQAYRCDAYFVDLAKSSQLIVDDTFYWYGLFSHQKVSHTWKGMLRIPLLADDAAAVALLANLSGASNGP